MVIEIKVAFPTQQVSIRRQLQTNDFLYLLKTPGWVVGLSTPGTDWEIRKWNSVYDFSSNQNIDWDSAPRKGGFDNSIYFDGNIYAIGDENGNTRIDDFYSETDSIHLWKYGDNFDSNKIRAAAKPLL